MQLDKIDLNLLRYLDSLLREQNVTHAANQLGITQPAMSNGLRRLRDLFHDPLLVRTSDGMMPTALAIQLQPRVQSILQSVDEVLHLGQSFEAESSSRVFRIMASDYAEATLIPPLMKKLQDEAPNVILDVMNPSDVSFHDVEKGQILIDDQPITDITQDSLRANIGMVTQDTSLLHRSIRENILYGDPHASDEKLMAAITQAQAAEFIDNLTDPFGNTGLDAQVGERGVKLSGGQRQRIAIARVLLKNAPILLLDEATSALDSEVEAAIQESLYELMEGKTVIAIAHRLSTIAAMDRLIVLDKGCVVEQGTHQELINAKGIYAQLWAHQTGGFLGLD